MKIIYVSRSILPSRTANSVHVMRMCQAFADNGHEVILLAPLTKKLEEQGVKNIFEYYGVKENFKLKKVYSPNIKYLKKKIYSLRCFNIIKKTNPDIVYGRDDILTFYLAKRSGFNAVFEKHAPLGEDKFNDILVKRMMETDKKTKLVLISESLKNIMKDDFSFKNVEVLIAHDAADITDNTVLPENIIVNKKRIQIGYIGSLQKGRGIDMIIELANRLSQYDFHIVGGKDKDIDFWKLKITSNNIIFHGFVKPNLAYMYRNICDILLAPYQTENEGNRLGLYQSPLKLFEYMASEKVIICSDLPNLREVLQDNVNACLVSYNDVDKWENKIKNILSDNQNMKKLSFNAYSDFIKNYTWKSRAKNILEFSCKSIIND